MSIIAARTKRVSYGMSAKQGGGNAKQGLPPYNAFYIPSGRGGWSHYLRNAKAPRRNWVFCMNQLSGVGAGRSMFKVAGLNKPDGARRCKPHPYGKKEENLILSMIYRIITTLPHINLATLSLDQGVTVSRTGHPDTWIFKEEDIAEPISVAELAAVVGIPVKIISPSLSDSIDKFVAHFSGKFMTNSAINGKNIGVGQNTHKKFAEVGTYTKEFRDLLADGMLKKFSTHEIEEIHRIFTSKEFYILLMKAVIGTVLSQRESQTIYPEDLVSLQSVAKSFGLNISTSEVTAGIPLTNSQTQAIETAVERYFNY